MLTLGIETSCDETALALVKDGKLLHSVMATQIDIHALFGGVVPELASREHYRLIGRLYDELLQQAGITAGDIDVVAVSRGPGLLGSLLVGLGFAKGLVAAGRARLVGVNHLHAHLLAPGLEEELEFPAAGLLVSGGHTHVYRICGPDDFTLLGRTLDDAAGEAFDKVAKMLNMPYPGGRFIDQLGRMAEPDSKLFTRPYIDNDNLDFSFSGLKTAVSLYIQKNPQLVLASQDMAPRLFDGSMDVSGLAHLCASFNHTVAETLRIKVERGIDQMQGRGESVRSLIVAGGVAANSRVREAMKAVAQRFGIRLSLPSLFLCTDNGAMVAYAGELLAQKGLSHGLDLDAIPRGQKIPDDYLRMDLNR
ncbi:tRNA (adenosine(37)-N6)-threonylcarbamoyltransferase complex transferase subunit TsaD [Desulfovibrio mangrovi]|uniref:tRNA (adenosine(37)-N6)-threonylcarbamoyltransferase complex transferase subunit TsaD n=1 Tax=Desulfovibrio mangrovi TaxID=2976983 RepID=UPI002246106F|nr:tRNA (adenosine(37)-N6)-threonylcarbamoyltransferase complex transferase subunit TsaD [Desulfovibrio mangrovi]UZP68275.1 tRNA (adenosine(37)-N6)-threonylcarbamoyltransferase complex transferase subunit TsaD [Desulfovibrio mangrovi]